MPKGSNPNSRANLRAGNKRSKSVYTVVDLLKAIKQVEAQINELMKHDKKGVLRKYYNLPKDKAFNYLHALLERSLFSDSLAGKILDRICPVPNNQTSTPININNQITVEKLPPEKDKDEILKTLSEVTRRQRISDN